METLLAVCENIRTAHMFFHCSFSRFPKCYGNTESVLILLNVKYIFFLSGDNAYTLNERLFAVPIHGPETACSVCHTKQESEYETEGSYVR